MSKARSLKQTVYIAIDGKEFVDEEMCKEWDEKVFDNHFDLYPVLFMPQKGTESLEDKLKCFYVIVQRHPINPNVKNKIFDLQVESGRVGGLPSTSTLREESEELNKRKSEDEGETFLSGSFALMDLIEDFVLNKYNQTKPYVCYESSLTRKSEFDSLEPRVKILPSSVFVTSFEDLTSKNLKDSVFYFGVEEIDGLPKPSSYLIDSIFN